MDGAVVWSESSWQTNLRWNSSEFWHLFFSFVIMNLFLFYLIKAYEVANVEPEPIVGPPPCQICHGEPGINGTNVTYSQQHFLDRKWDFSTFIQFSSFSKGRPGERGERGFPVRILNIFLLNIQSIKMICHFDRAQLVLGVRGVSRKEKDHNTVELRLVQKTKFQLFWMKFSYFKGDRGLPGLQVRINSNFVCSYNLK